MKQLRRKIEVAARKSAAFIKSKPVVAAAVLMPALCCHAADPTDMDGIATWLTTNKGPLILIGVALAFLAVAKRLFRKTV